MPQYVYSAADPVGKTIKGTMSAINEHDLEQRLRDLDLVLLNMREEKRKSRSLISKIRAQDLIMFCVHMQQLAKAGVPILDSIADMRDAADTPAFRDLMAEIHENIKTGDQLSLALEKRPDVFDQVFIGLIAAGEETGEIGDAFGHLVDHLKWNNELKRSIKKAIRYPMFLLAMMTGVIAMMMLFVVPKLVDFITSQGWDLPVHTKALIWLSGSFVDYWAIILLTPIIAVIAIIVLYRNSYAVKHALDRMFLHVPLIGPVIMKINLARFTHFFSITFSSGIGVLECLNVAKNVVNNEVIRDTIVDISNYVSEGNSITRAVDLTEKFPNLVVRMFRVGEESGNMSNALDNVKYFYDQEVKDAVQSMIGAIQPMLTIVMGGLMFWIIAAIFGPLYESFSKINF